MKSFFKILIVIITISCSNSKMKNERISIPYPDSKEQSKWDSENTIDSLWTILKNKKGCLTGGQYVDNGEFGSEGCVMTTTAEWKLFFDKPKNELTNFLVNKLAERDTTKVHNCPLFMSTEGELAVYALQNIHKKNWFDFKEFERFKIMIAEPKMPPYSNRDTFSGYLNDSVLTNKEELLKLRNVWGE